MARQAASRPDSSHLLDYVRVLLKRLWLILGFFVLVVGVVGFATYRAVPVFSATAVLNIKQPNVAMRPFDPTSFVTAINSSALYRSTQYALLRQRSTVQEMVTRKGLENWNEFDGMSESEIIDSIIGRIDVSPRKGTTLVYVSVENTDRDVVHKITNALVETFQELEREKAKLQLESSLSSLESEWTQNRTKAQLQENNISTLLEQHETDRETFLQEYEFARKRTQTLRGDLDRVADELASKKSLHDRIKAALEEGNGSGLESLHGVRVVAENERIRQIERNLVLEMRRLQRLQVELGPTNPQVVSLKVSIDDERALLSMEKDAILLGIYEDYRGLEVRQSTLEARLAAFLEEFRQFSLIKRKYDGLLDLQKRYEDEAEKFYATWEKLQDSGKGERGLDDAVKIVERARQPFTPIRPDRQLNMILAMVFGLLGGIGLAFFLEYLDDTIKTKEELERISQVPLFGVIPNISGKRGDLVRKDLYAHDQPKSTVSEAFRGIRTALSYSSQKQENRIYLVTSGGPKEGKTTIVINVATVMAYSGTRTLLVDCDLRKPRVHRSLNVENAKGLSNVIVGEMDVGEVIQKTEIENLDVLTSGPIPPNPSELLGRPRMAEVLQELRQRYDRILLDTPPIGAVTDAAVLGRIADSVILVIHAGKTRKKLIERALEQLSQIDVDVSGIVLNNLKIGRKRYYPGYYHYYYYYSSYYGSDDKPKGKSKGGKG